MPQNIELTNPMYNDAFTSMINLSLIEDIFGGEERADITSNLVITDEQTAEFTIIAKEEFMICGINVAADVFKQVAAQLLPNKKIEITNRTLDGNLAKPGEILLKGSGNAKIIMAAERTALNILRFMSGTATTTSEFVALIKDSKAKLLDTRKTIPGLRTVQKYAVKTGGGYNHRFGLFDAILIKDNHIAVCGGVKNALSLAQKNLKNLKNSNVKIEIECDTIEQFKEALEHGADMVLLDNMDIATLKAAVAINNGKIPLEASGNVNKTTIKAIAATGVDYISVGSLTSNARNVDIGLDIELLSAN